MSGALLHPGWLYYHHPGIPEHYQVIARTCSVRSAGYDTPPGIACQRPCKNRTLVLYYLQIAVYTRQAHTTGKVNAYVSQRNHLRS